MLSLESWHSGSSSWGTLDGGVFLTTGFIASCAPAAGIVADGAMVDFEIISRETEGYNFRIQEYQLQVMSAFKIQVYRHSPRSQCRRRRRGTTSILRQLSARQQARYASRVRESWQRRAPLFLTLCGLRVVHGATARLGKALARHSRRSEPGSNAVAPVPIRLNAALPRLPLALHDNWILAASIFQSDLTQGTAPCLVIVVGCIMARLPFVLRR